MNPQLDQLIRSLTEASFLTNYTSVDDHHRMQVLLPFGSAVIASLDMSWEGDMPFLSSVHVRGDARRQGVGRRMIQKAMRICQIHRKHSLSLWVRKTNEPAIALYRQLGFERYFADEPNIFMSRLIDAAPATPLPACEACSNHSTGVCDSHARYPQCLTAIGRRGVGEATDFQPIQPNPEGEARE